MDFTMYSIADWSMTDRPIVYFYYLTIWSWTLELTIRKLEQSALDKTRR